MLKYLHRFDDGLSYVQNRRELFANLFKCFYNKIYILQDSECRIQMKVHKMLAANFIIPTPN